MSPPDRPTWSVSELHAELNATVAARFGTAVWVAGELHGLHRSKKGHVYFDLLDIDSAGDPSRRPRISVVLFDWHRNRVNQLVTRYGAGSTMADGMHVRICGELGTWAEAGALRLVMTSIDPAFTLAATTAERDRVLAALSAERLLDRNGRHPVPTPALRVALVTANGSAAQADVMHELHSSGFAFEVLFLDARTQGPDAPRSLVAALRTAVGLGPDLVMLVRGGGARTDLVAFDHESVARAIAAAEVPVFTGIGHETDRSVADEVAHTAHKTPTACAAAVVEIAAGAGRTLDRLAAGLPTAARGRALRAGSQVQRLAHGTTVACRGHLGRESAAVQTRAERIAAAAPMALRRNGDRLGAAAALVGAHDPGRLLARGWSITRTAAGATVRSVAELDVGESLVTQLSDGSVQSEVRSIDHRAVGRPDPTDPTDPTEGGTT